MSLAPMITVNVTRPARQLTGVFTASVRQIEWPSVTPMRIPPVRIPPVNFTRAVDAGVEFLDERLGRDVWLPRINTSTLDVRSQFECVVCQVTGETYAQGVELLGGPGVFNGLERLAWSAERGFAAIMSFDASYYHLTRAWITKVIELRAEVNA